MSLNRGKQWEMKVKECWHKTMPNSFILRLPDQQSGYHLSSNVSDYIAFKSPRLFLLECKSVLGNTVPFANLTQYEKMLPYKNVEDIFPGFMVWWVEHGIVAWVPVETVECMKKENKKSVNVKNLKDDSTITIIPTVKKRILLDCDFSILMRITK